MANNLHTSMHSNSVSKIKNIMRTSLKDSNKDISQLMNKVPVEDGKLIRTLFVLTGAGFGNIEEERLSKICAAIELLHLATLIHDDILDETEMRRGKETLHNQYGVKPGLIAGDYVFAESFVLFAQSCSAKTITEVSETIKFVCKSEINQHFSLFNFSSNSRDYLRRINGKCASLFSLSLSIGAAEGGSDENTVKTLKKIGYYSGMAFQMIDDILDLSATTEVLGKSAGNDIKQGVYTLPIIYELKNGNEFLRQLILEGKYSEVISQIRNSEGYKKTIALAENYTNRSIALIDQLPDSNEKNDLKALMSKLLFRNY